jgi:tetratricopeptide (TPR) repeat protein
MNLLIALLLAGGVPPYAPVPPTVRAARIAVESASGKYGPQHPATAMMLRNLALAFEQSGFHSEAVKYAGQSITILDSTFGDKDVSLVPALHVMAESLSAQTRYAEAEAVERRAVAIGPDAGTHYGTALQNLGAILELQGKVKSSEAAYRQALSVRESLLPAGHLHTAITRASLARVEQSTR